MVESRSGLTQEYLTKGNAVGNYRPIACLNLLWKLLSGILTDKLYEHLENQNLLSEEQNGFTQRSHCTKDQLLIDKGVIKNCKSRKNQYIFEYGPFMIPHSWMTKSLELVRTSKNIVNLLRETMKS